MIAHAQSSSGMFGGDFSGVALEQSDERSAGISPRSLALVLHDFAALQQKASLDPTVRRSRPLLNSATRECVHATSKNCGELSLYKNGLVWYGGLGAARSGPISSPNDYAALREDPVAMRDYLQRLLRGGRIERLSLDEKFETNPADCFKWLWKNCEYEPFRKNLESELLNLITEELSHPKLPMAESLKIQLDAMRKVRADNLFKYYNTDNPRQTLEAMLGELRSEGQVADANSKAYFSDLINFWPFRQAGAPGAISLAERNYIIEQLNACDWQIEKLDEGVVELFWQGCVDKPGPQAICQAVEQYNSGYKLLNGLLEVSSFIAAESGEFAKKALSVLEKGMPLLDRFSNIRFAVLQGEGSLKLNFLLALGAAQGNGGSLQGFWLTGLMCESDADALRGWLVGLFRSVEKVDEKRCLISSVVEALNGCWEKLGGAYRNAHCGFGFSVDRLDDFCAFLLREAGYVDAAGDALCFHTEARSRLLRLVEFAQSRPGFIEFRGISFKNGGISHGKAVYEIATDSVAGDVGLETLVRKHLQAKGYPLSACVSVTSLKGRQVLSPTGDVLAYEGVVGLNYSPFAFRFDAQSNQISLAVPACGGTHVTGVGWQRNRIFIGLRGSKLVSDFSSSLDEVGKLTDDQIAVLQPGKNDEFPDPMLTLKGNINNSLTANLVAVVRERLVKRGDGLEGH